MFARRVYAGTRGAHPRRWLGRDRGRGRKGGGARRGETPGPGCWRLGRDRVFGEDLLDPLRRLLGGLLGLHAALHDVGPADAPDMLVADLGIGRVVDVE